MVIHLTVVMMAEIVEAKGAKKPTVRKQPVVPEISVKGSMRTPFSLREGDEGITKYMESMRTGMFVSGKDGRLGARR